MDAPSYTPVIPPLQALNAITPYDGREDPDAWLNSIQAIAALYNWTDGICLKVARVRLTGPAWGWAQTRHFNSWAAFQQQLVSRYGETKESAIARLECCWQRTNEPVKDFAERYLQNAAKAGRIEDDALVYNFIQRLQPYVKLEVARQRLQSIEEIVTFCDFWSGLLHGGDENMDPTDTTAEPWPFSHPCNLSGRPGHPDGSPREPGYNGPAYRAPPLRDNNRGSAATTPRPAHMPQLNLHSVLPAPAAAPRDAALNKAQQKLMRLELDAHRRLQDKDREIRTLQFALKMQRQQQANKTQFSHVAPMYSTKVADTATDDEDDSNHELLPSVFVQQSAGSEPQCTRASVNHTTLTPAEAARPPVASPLQERVQAAREAARHMPCRSQPYDAPATPTAHQGAYAAAEASIATSPNMLSYAAQAVGDEAKRMSADICRGLHVASMQDATLPPQAVLTTLAGHLARDQALINSGHDMASTPSCGTTVLRGIVHEPLALGHALPLLASPGQSTHQNTQSDVCQPVQAVPGVTTACKVMTKTAGDPDKQRGNMQVNPPAQTIGGAWTPAYEAADCLLKAAVAVASSASATVPRDTAHMLWDSPVAPAPTQSSPRCFAATGKPFVGKDALAKLCFSETWDPGPAEDSDTLSAAAATALQQHDTAEKHLAEETPQTLPVNGILAVPPTTAQASEPIPPLTQAGRPDLQSRMQSYAWLNTKATSRISGSNARRQKQCMQCPVLPRLLTFGLTSLSTASPRLGVTEQTAAAKAPSADSAAALDHTGSAASPQCRHPLSHLWQGFAELHQEDLTMFDPGGPPPSPHITVLMCPGTVSVPKGASYAHQL